MTVSPSGPCIFLPLTRRKVVRRKISGRTFEAVSRVIVPWVENHLNLAGSRNLEYFEKSMSKICRIIGSFSVSNAAE